MEQQPSYYSILTADVRYNKNISSSEKLFYSEITAMSNKHGYCWASNSYFSKLFSVSNSTISIWVKHLQNQKHIKVDYEKKGKQVIKRMIYPIQKNDKGYSENLNRGGQKIGRGYSENLKENITSNNINNVSQSETTYKDEYIINLDKEETRKQIDDKDEELQFRIAKSLNSFFVEYCQKNGIKVKNHIIKAKASKEMWSIKQLLKDYDEIDVRKVIKWLYDGKGNAEFWQRQIQSASGFRDKFEKMKLQMINNKQKEKRL
jgi:hypothetical protein